MPQAQKLVALTSTLLCVLALAGAAPLAAQHTLVGPVALAWESRFSPGVDSSPRALALSPGGGAVYVAEQIGFSSSQCRVSARDAATGAELWAALAAGADDTCIPWRLAVSPDGSVVYVASRTNLSGLFVDGALVAAYDAATGAGLWSVLYDGPGDEGFSIADLGLSPDGSRLFLAGNRDDSFSTIRAAAFQAATGGLLWESVYATPSIFGEGASALAVSPDGGRLYVTGSVQSGDDKDDFLTLAYEAATGAQIWESRYEGPADSRNGAVDVAVSPDGAAVFVTGLSFRHLTSYDAATAAYDAATGAELWAVRHNGPADDFDQATALAVSPDGGTVFVAGTSSTSASDRDVLAVAYDAATGAETWLVRTGRGGGEQAVALALGPGGAALFVTGYTSPDTPGDFDPDFLTVAFATGTGAELWSARYQGTGSGEDQAVAMAAAPAGDALFVTGSSVGVGGLFDIVTLAYRLGTPSGRIAVTGGGWFDSPAGAFPARPAATGKAHLSLIATLRNGTVPGGSASFRFGGLDLRSTSFDRLVVAGGRADLQGRGTLRGSAGEYRFLLSVLDAPPGRRAGRDQVRVKIWNATSGAIVYDSQPSAPDAATPAIPLGGGSIAIHR